MMVRVELNSPFEAQHILLTAFARCVPCAGHKEPGIADKPTADSRRQVGQRLMRHNLAARHGRLPLELDIEIADPGAESERVRSQSRLRPS